MAYVQKLIYSKVRAAAQRFYEARRLTAQHPIQQQRRCVYSMEDGKYCCAIGAGMSKKTLAQDHRIGTIGDLATNGFVNCGPAANLERLQTLQSAHDSWARTSHYSGASSSNAQLERKKFVKLLYAK